MDHNDARGLVGMDPEKMQALIREIRAAHHAIGTFAGEFTAPLSAVGISVSTLHQAERWVHDQIPMLTDRLKKLEENAHTTPDQHGQGAGSPGKGTGGTGTAGAGTTGAGAGGTAATGAATGGGGTGGTGPAASGAGTSAPGSGSYVPPSPAPQPPTHPTAKHAMLDAKHVTHAAQHGESMPAQVWDDIERNATNRQYALAYLAAIGAAGLAALAAAIAKSRKKNKDKQEADRREAALNEMLASAGAAPSATVPVTPEEIVTPPVPGGQHTPPPGTENAHPPASGVSVVNAGPPPDGEPARPRLRLVTTESTQAGDAAPALDRAMGDQ